MQCPFGSRRSVRPKPKPGLKVQSPAYRLEISSLQVSASIHSNFTIQHPNIWHQNEQATTRRGNYLPPQPYAMRSSHSLLPTDMPPPPLLRSHPSPPIPLRPSQFTNPTVPSIIPHRFTKKPLLSHEPERQKIRGRGGDRWVFGVWGDLASGCGVERFEVVGRWMLGQ